MSSQPPTTPSQAPITQERPEFRRGLPEWMKQLPRTRFPDQDKSFQLIDPEQLATILGDSDPESINRIKDDMKFLDKELLRLFRDRDYDAKFQQNRYRTYQIGYMLLAAIATLIGSFLALAQSSNPQLVPWLGFTETLVALATTYLATISGREPALPKWLENRRKAEHLRREYYRYLMDLTPYDGLVGYDRRRMLSLRSAN
ncbi:MAG: DUF4231 domain-containing protein, partial [Armatimonadetes bacterium]|nr:DUF4231 domain-containing protein [Anaerolineae bacterium]